MADDATLAEFLATLEDFVPVIPDELVDYYLATAGFECPDARLTRLIGVATQKFVSDIASDALQYCKMSAARSSAASKSGKLVLTSEDLTTALRDFGVNARKQDYYAEAPDAPNSAAGANANANANAPHKEEQQP